MLNFIIVRIFVLSLKVVFSSKIKNEVLAVKKY